MAELSKNMRAFLDMIAHAEGTAGKGDNGYNVVVGGGLFDNYSTHPKRLVRLNPKLSSTAAGRYQLLSRYYDHYRKKLGLKDFSPDSQDAIAVQQIRECGAVPDIEAGRFDAAVRKVCRIWASLPGAGYGQREHSLDRLRSVYTKSGGGLSAA